jgi:hypothetical protein
MVGVDLGQQRCVTGIDLLQQRVVNAVHSIAQVANVGLHFRHIGAGVPDIRFEHRSRAHVCLIILDNQRVRRSTHDVHRNGLTWILTSRGDFIRVVCRSPR